MDKKNTKEVMFHIWDELIFLLEELYKQQPNNELVKDILYLQKEKLTQKEISHSRLLRVPIDINNLSNSVTDNIQKSIILKWEELVIESYFYLQEARMSGGTLGHKVGVIWFFQRETKEKHKENILKLRYF